MATLRIGVFSPSVLMDVVRATGRLHAAGLDQVQQVAVRSSPEAFASLRDGELDLLLTSPDNVLAYRFLPSNPLATLLDVEMVAAVDRGTGLCLGLRPGIDDVRQVCGGRLGVDVATSGFAFVAYGLLAAAGLSRDDFEIVPLGSTPNRARALIAAECDVTVLGAGSELLARDHGCVLTSGVRTIGPYLGTVFAQITSSPAATDAERLVTVAVETAGEICSGRYDELVAASASRLLGLHGDSAVAHAALLRDPQCGLVGDGTVDAAALRTLIDLRSRFMPAPELAGIMHQLNEVVRPGRFAADPSA